MHSLHGVPWALRGSIARGVLEAVAQGSYCGFVCGVLLGMRCSLVLCFVCWLPSALGAWRFSAPLPVLSDVLTDSPLLTIDNSKQRALDLEKAWLGVEACCRQEGFVCLLQRPLAELSLSLKVRGKLLRRLCSRFLDRDC